MPQAFVGNAFTGVADPLLRRADYKTAFSYKTWTSLKFSLRHAESFKHAHSASHAPNRGQENVPHRVQILSVTVSCVGEGRRSRKMRKPNSPEMAFHSDLGFADFSPPLPPSPVKQLAVNKPVSH